MTRSLVIGALVVGQLCIVACSATHDLDDATTDSAPRDGATHDTATNDAFCPDADGDGFRDARCGGDDCDDSNPRVGPHMSACTGPDRLERCDGAAAVTVACVPPTPDCDARIGACAAHACGDGVLHADEECDDGNNVSGDGCEADCTRPRCQSNADCTAAGFMPGLVCSDYRVDGFARCRLGHPGAAIGTRCHASTECASGWCDASQGRCSIACSTTSDCGSGAVFCTREALPMDPMMPAPNFLPPRCTFGCYYEGDCDASLTCGFAGIRNPDGTWWLPSFCYPREGPLEAGAACTGGVVGQCRLWCNRFCTSACRDASDCPAVLPRCAEFPPSHVRRPASWPQQATICEM